MSSDYSLSYYVVCNEGKWQVKEVREREVEVLSDKEDAIKRAKSLAHDAGQDCSVEVSDEEGVIKRGIKKVADKINRAYNTAKDELKS